MDVSQRVSWLSSKMDDLDLFLEVMGVNLNTITQQIIIALSPNLYHGCISLVSRLSSKMDDLDLFFRSWGLISTWKLAIFACKHDNSTNISRIVSKLIPGMYLRSVLVKFEDRWPWPIFRSWGSISTWKFAIFICKHDNSTHISHIGPKLMPWMYLRSVLVKFEYGWPWPIFRGHGGRFQHENLQFLHVNTITTNISHIGPKLIPWMYLRSGLVNLEAGWPWSIFRGHGGRFQHENLQYLLVNMITNITRINPKLIPLMYLKGVLVSSKIDDLDLATSWRQM